MVQYLVYNKIFQIHKKQCFTPIWKYEGKHMVMLIKKQLFAGK